MAVWETLPGETPIDDISGLKIVGITTRKQLSFVEAENILEATVTLRALKCADDSFDMGPLIELHERFSEAT